MSSIIQQIQKKIKGLSCCRLIITIIFLACLIIFLLILIGVVLKHNNSFDEFVFRKLRLITSPALTKIMLYITFFGSHDFLLPAYILLLIFYLFIREKTPGILIALIGLSSTAVLFSLKYLIKRSRPLDPLVHAVNGFSFPSGHSFSGFTFFGILIYMVWQFKMKKTVKWILSFLLFFFAFIIALSRIYLHIHFASDVLAGFCLGIVWLTLSFWILEAVKKKQ